MEPLLNQVELLKNKITALSTLSQTKETRIYLGLCCKEIETELIGINETLGQLYDDSLLEKELIRRKIDEKEQEIAGTAEFRKTFMPLMLLHNCGLVRRTNW